MRVSSGGWDYRRIRRCIRCGLRIPTLAEACIYCTEDKDERTIQLESVQNRLRGRK